MKLKPLGVVKEIVESIGMNISYAHEDLVFMEHNAFLLQFTSKNDEILVHQNKEADLEIVAGDIDRLKASASHKAIKIERGSVYKLSQEDDENIRITFY